MLGVVGGKHQEQRCSVPVVTLAEHGISAWSGGWVGGHGALQAECRDPRRHQWATRGNIGGTILLKLGVGRCKHRPN